MEEAARAPVRRLGVAHVAQRGESRRGLPTPLTLLARTAGHRARFGRVPQDAPPARPPRAKPRATAWHPHCPSDTTTRIGLAKSPRHPSRTTSQKADPRARAQGRDKVVSLSPSGKSTEHARISRRQRRRSHAWLIVNGKILSSRTECCSHFAPRAAVNVTQRFKCRHECGDRCR